MANEWLLRLICLAISVVAPVTVYGVRWRRWRWWCGCVRLSYSQQQSAVKSRDRPHHWIIVGVLCVLTLAWHVAVTSFRQLHRAYHLVELCLRRQQVPAHRAPLAAGVIVVAVVVAGVAAVCAVGSCCWRKLTSCSVAAWQRDRPAAMTSPMLNDAFVIY